ncbi:2-oxoacid:acceptor oxidoreductase family protein [Candidatus Sumerlaeota bacterium]|nr:2-oxoacid:acceptor oxidoreductase family protein [Candidatus Sumerlaeota bacterium]
MRNTKILPRVNKYGFYEIRMESIGGFGANVAGKILAQAAIVGMGLNGANFSSYGSEKMGTPMKTYVRLTEEDTVRINSPVTEPHLVVIFHTNLIQMLPVLEGIQENGKLVVNTNKPPEEIREEAKVPGGITIYCVDAFKIAVEEKVRINTPLLGAICRATEFIDGEQVKYYITKMFEKKYPHTIEPNRKAFDRGFNEVSIMEVPDDNKYPFVEYKPYVSPLGYENAPIGGAITDFGNAYIKDLSGSRAGYVAVYYPEKCIHCGFCSFACPDFCIIFKEETDPKTGKKLMFMKGIDYKHCKGCLRCVEVCPTEALRAEIEAEVSPEKLKSVV